ncbi:Pycsar system effector family protein [Allopontixanthobacter sp.]|uniref:Pycsar system effector family protein n=1 Tax=Allopontixanthobacter sp. TaxID=2906452 RepID=UPI002ABADBD1|nr:Pycsar system effector family protein [Allopontixanthobacter sp.]MDZ4308812.1 DUF5706 domain-containing protein [Allopontixanthobacter sp.]
MESELVNGDRPPAAMSAEKPERVFSENAIHMIRTAQINTLTLSQMADQKASILMGATFLVFSLSISRSLTGDMPASLVLLALFSFLSSVCAVIAVVPSIGKAGADPRSKPNRLFFGHFTAIEEPEWAESLLEDMTRDETVLRTMMHDLYQNGCVLQRRKYRYLALAYRIFIAGLVVTLLVFGIETIR